MNQRRLNSVQKHLVALFWLLLGGYGCFAQDFDESVFFQKKEVEIVVGLKEYPPFIMEYPDKDTTYYDGISIVLWEDIAKKNKIKYRYVMYNDIWSIIAALKKHEIDITIYPFTVTPTKLKTFEVSQPFFISSMGVAVSTRERGSLKGYLMKMFSAEFLTTIMMVLIAVVSVGTVMWFTERRRNSIEFAEGHRGIFDGIWWAAVTMTTVGYGDKIPKTIIGRILSIVWMLTAVTIISSFTASIIAHLNSARDIDIRSITDLHDIYGGIGTVSHSGSADFLDNNEINVSHPFNSCVEGLNALRKGEIKVFIYDKPIMQYMINNHNLEDDVEILPFTFNKDYYSFMASERSTLIKKINPDLIDIITMSEWAKHLNRYSLKE